MLIPRQVGIRDPQSAPDLVPIGSNRGMGSVLIIIESVCAIYLNLLDSLSGGAPTATNFTMCRSDRSGADKVEFKTDMRSNLFCKLTCMFGGYRAARYIVAFWSRIKASVFVFFDPWDQ